MGRPRKKRNDEGLPPQSYSSWSTDSSASAMDPSIAQPDDSMGFPGLSAPNPQAAGFAMMENAGMGNTSMDYGYGNVMNYIDPDSTQSGLADANLAPTDLNIDFSTLNFSAANTPSLSAPYSSPPEYTYPVSSTGHLSPLPTPSLPTSPLPPSSPQPPCQCPATLYKTLQAISSIAGNPTFPQALQPLRAGTTTAKTLLLCRVCSQSYPSALQNSMGSVTLMQLLVHTYAKLLSHIDARARSSPKIKTRFGEAATPSTQHMHSGDLNCSMGVDIDLSGAEWRSLARKTVRKAIMGDDDSDDDDDDDDDSEYDCLLGVLHGLRKRQRAWHNGRRFERDVQHQHGGEEGQAKEGCICLPQVQIEQLIRSVMGLGL